MSKIIALTAVGRFVCVGSIFSTTTITIVPAIRGAMSGRRARLDEEPSYRPSRFDV